MRCSRCGNLSHLGQPCLCRQLSQQPPLVDNLAPALAPVADSSPDWQAEVRDRLRRYQVRRGRIAGNVQAALEFSPLPPASAPDNLIIFQKPSAAKASAAAPVGFEAASIPGAPAADVLPALDPGTTVLPDLALAISSDSSSPLAEDFSDSTVVWQTAVPISGEADFSALNLQSIAGEPGENISSVEESSAPAPLAVTPSLLCEPIISPVIEHRSLPAVSRVDWAPIAIAPREPAAALQKFPVLPLPPAPAGVRFRAACADAGIVLAASLLFSLVSIACLGLPHLASPRQGFILAGMICGLWGAIYIVVSLSLNGATAGMRWQGLLLHDFSGRPTTARSCRRRAGMMLFSLAALGFGFWWMFLDDDQLAWHDYWSSTYLVVPVPAASIFQSPAARS